MKPIARRSAMSIASIVAGAIGMVGAAWATGPGTLLFENDFEDIANSITHIDVGGFCQVGTSPCTTGVLAAGASGNEIGFPQSGFPTVYFPVDDPINSADNIDKAKGTIRFRYRPLAGTNIGDWNLTPPTDGNWSSYNPSQKVLFRLYDPNFPNLASLKIGTYYDSTKHLNYLYFRYDGSTDCNPGFSASTTAPILPACAREVSAISAEPDLAMEWDPNTAHSVVVSWDFVGSAPFMAISVDGMGGESRLLSAPNISGFTPTRFYVGSNAGSTPAQGRIDKLEIYSGALSLDNPVQAYKDRTENDGVWQPHETVNDSDDAPLPLDISGQPFIFYKSYSFERIYPGTVPSTATDPANVTIDVVKNQHETAFFNIYAGEEDLEDVTATVSNLTSGSNTINQSRIKIRTVKNWWQAGTKVMRNFFVPVFTPELLVYDDTTPAECTGSDNDHPCTSLQFFSDPYSSTTRTEVAAQTSRQFAITLDIPGNTVAGTYTGTITVDSSEGYKTLPINVVVHNIVLPEIDKTVALYTGSQITSATADSYVTGTYLSLQMQNMREHGVNGLLFGGEAPTLPNLYPDLAETAGMAMAAYPFYSNNPPLTTTEKNNATALVGGLVQADFVPFLYGDDEPTSTHGNMPKHLAQTKAIHEACTTGLTPNVCGKVIVAITKDWADKLNDPAFFGSSGYTSGGVTYSFADAKLDVPNLNAEAAETQTVAYFDALLGGDHSSRPNRPELYYWQMYREDPRINRFYTGYHLWLTDLAGVMPYNYQRVMGDPYDDFDQAAADERDTVTTYPSVQGSVDTIEWEAFRAGLDDYRLLQLWRTLDAELSLCEPTSATEYQGDLEAILGKYRHRQAFSSVSRESFALDRKALIDLLDDMNTEINVGAGNRCKHGLTASYFNDSDTNSSGAITALDDKLVAPAVLQRIDSNVDMNLASLVSPGSGVNVDYFSTRWTGRLVVPNYTGTYTFCLKGDDGYRLWVNNVDLFANDHWAAQDSVYDCATINLTAGQVVPIEVEFFDLTEEAILQLTWSWPGQAEVVVPNSALYAE